MPEQRKYNRTTMEDVRRWADKYRNRISIVKIAEEEGVDPGTIGSWLHKLRLDIGRGQHFVQQPPLVYSSTLIELVTAGPAELCRFLQQSVWGIRFTKSGLERLSRFCRFVEYHKERKGVEEISKAIGVHRSTILGWRNGTNQPYLVKTANAVLPIAIPEGWWLIPRSIESGGNVVKHWLMVPREIKSHDDVGKVVYQQEPLKEAFSRALQFGISPKQVHSMRTELFAYLLGIMLGDAGKLHAEQKRFTSLNLDLQLTQKEASNERLGEFVSMCANLLGIAMRRTKDKPPTGSTRNAEEPAPAFRWVSSRCALLAWMFHVGLGLNPGELTSTDKVRMNWVLRMPVSFRRRFVQGMADSDGTVRRYVVEIASMPNAEFVTMLLKGLGMASAHTLYEKGIPTRSSVSNKEAALLPIFNELVNGYRHQMLLRLT